MKGSLMRMGMLGAARWAGNRAVRSRAPLVRTAGKGLAASVWAVPLLLYAVRRMRGR
ncbi:MAG TPA: hypothetical protein VEW03_13300 [Longimicrobiaceae bacterium]|nr:hypothetical protein [Longimicrobiaceae bacterium]